MCTRIFTIVCALAALNPSLGMCAPVDNGTPNQDTFHRVDLDHGFYLLSSPTGYTADDPLPIVICLHGTETTAADILTFWQSFDHKLPMLMVAPQGIRAGWREADSPLITEFLEHIGQTLNYDHDRILLTGHSAGGAMAFHLLYVRAFHATAVAVTANYVPPTVKAEHVRQHHNVPIFYAVGESDINRDRMRSGLSLLRDNGASITVKRPNIGHVLDPQIGQTAMTWFESVCRANVESVLTDARTVVREDRHPADIIVTLEDIIRRRATQFPDQVTSAMELLADLQRPGRRHLVRAERLLQQHRAMEARSELLAVEQRYRPSSLANEAHRRRLEIEVMPEVIEVLRIRNAAMTESPTNDS